MRLKWLKQLIWPIKYAHSSFSSLVYSSLPKDTLLRTYSNVVVIQVYQLNCNEKSRLTFSSSVLLYLIS